MTYVIQSLTLILVLLLGACASKNNQQQVAMFVAPAEVNYRVELTLAKLNEYLHTQKLTQAQRARFLYDRGVLYDSVGLKTLARIDFHQALKLQPTLADAYNFLGIYYTQDQAYGRAFNAFDAVLELQPDYQYVYLNRGLASYYNMRNDLAVNDFQQFLDLNPRDGYRILWLYLAMAREKPDEARKELERMRTPLDSTQWDSKIIDMMLGNITQQDMFIESSLQLTYRNEIAERMCEVYFYLGKKAQINKNYYLAMDYFKLALATNVYDFVEHRYARLELYQSIQMLRDAQKDS